MHRKAAVALIAFDRLPSGSPSYTVRGQNKTQFDQRALRRHDRLAGYGRRRDRRRRTSRRRSRRFYQLGNFVVWIRRENIGRSVLRMYAGRFFRKRSFGQKFLDRRLLRGQLFHGLVVHL